MTDWYANEREKSHHTLRRFIPTHYSTNVYTHIYMYINGVSLVWLDLNDRHCFSRTNTSTIIVLSSAKSQGIYHFHASIFFLYFALRKYFIRCSYKCSKRRYIFAELKKLLINYILAFVSLKYFKLLPNLSYYIFASNNFKLFLVLVVFLSHLSRLVNPSEQRSSELIYSFF